MENETLSPPILQINYIYTIKDYSVTHRISLGIWIDVLKTIDNKQFEKIKKSVEKVFPTSASEQLSFIRREILTGF